MVDPILDEELRRSRRMKQYQEYQNMVDNLENSSADQSTGKIEGKTVKKLSDDEGTVRKIFKSSVDDTHHK